jgi:hypothetical protein
MVMDWTRTEYTVSHEYPVLNTVTTNIEEGTPLEFITQSGSSVTTVQPSAGGSASNYFAGVAKHQYTLPTVMTNVEVVTVPSASPYTVTLQYAPSSPGMTTMFAQDQTTGPTDLSYNSGVSTNQYKVTTQTATFNSGQAGHSVYIVYKYAITVAAAQALVGNGVVGSSSEQVLSSVGVIQVGNIYTTFFDAAQDWTVTPVHGIVAVANNVFSLTGTGAAVTGTVIAIPSTDYPYLGLRIIA